MKNLYLILSILIIAISCKSKPSLEDKINIIIKDKKAKVGVAIIDLNTGETTSINDNEPFPLLSTFKYHVAVKVLDEVDKGNLSLNQQINIASEEILENTYSPLKDTHGSTDMSMRSDSLIYYMVSLSDNNACDILLRRIGGPEAVNKYFVDLKIQNTNISVNEEQMHMDWETQFKNNATPLSLAEALKRFYLREYLSGDSHNFLWAMMSNSPTGKNRIKSGVPTDWQVAHKTGTSDRNTEGLSAATNDIGIIQSPDNKSHIVVVLVSQSKETDESNEKIIADITKAVVND